MIKTERIISVLRTVVKKLTDVRVYDWVQEVEHLGAGELLITSMHHDGMKQGFDIEHLAKIKQLVNIPIIASGVEEMHNILLNCFNTQMFLQV